MESIHIRDAYYSDLPEVAPMLSKAYWDNNLMGEILHPNRHKYPGDFDLYWLRQLRLFFWDWRSKFLVAVGKDADGKDVIAGYAHWMRKGDGGKEMDLWWSDPRNILQPLTSVAMKTHALIWPNRACDPEKVDIPDQSYQYFNKIWSGERAESWFLECLGIHPDFQGKGVGQRLVRWGLNQAEKDGICASVIVALGKDGFYQKCGFDEQYGSARSGEGNPLADVEGWNIWWRMPKSNRTSMSGTH